MEILKINIDETNLMTSTLRLAHLNPSLLDIKKAIEQEMFDVEFDVLEILYANYYKNNSFQVNVNDLVFEFYVEVKNKEAFVEFQKAFDENCELIIYTVKDQYVIENYLENKINELLS